MGIFIPSVTWNNSERNRYMLTCGGSPRVSMASRMKFDRMAESCVDEEMAAVYRSYRKKGMMYE